MPAQVIVTQLPSALVLAVKGTHADIVEVIDPDAAEEVARNLIAQAAQVRVRIATQANLDAIAKAQAAAAAVTAAAVPPET